MTEKLIGRHAVDVGGGLTVEPGAEIPSEADPDIVNRLRETGQLYDADADDAQQATPEPPTTKTKGS